MNAQEEATTTSISRDGSRRLLILAVLAIVGPAFFVASAALLPLFSEYCFVEDHISELAIGRHGYVQTVAFFAAGIGSLALVLGVRETTKGARGSHLGSVLVGLFAINVVLAGIFPTDAIAAQGQVRSQTTAGIVHFAAALLAYAFGIAGMLVLSRTFRQDARWRPFRPLSLALTLAALAMFLALLFLPVPNADRWAGLYQRVFVGTVVSWLILAAIRLRSIAVGSSAGRPSRVR